MSPVCALSQCVKQEVPHLNRQISFLISFEIAEDYVDTRVRLRGRFHCWVLIFIFILIIITVFIVIVLTVFL